MSYLAPIVPDNSPFSPAQRAWLNGLLAGLLGSSRAGERVLRARRRRRPADRPRAGVHRYASPDLRRPPGPLGIRPVAARRAGIRPDQLAGRRLGSAPL